MKRNGFSLLELMMAIGIVGILAAIAIPAYMNYTLRVLTFFEVPSGTLFEADFPLPLPAHCRENGKGSGNGVVPSGHGAVIVIGQAMVASR